MEKTIKQIPNILSAARIVICFILFFLTGYPVAFTILYLLAGISDVADGYLARKLNAQTPLGAKLDSAGDVVLYLLIIYVFVFFTNLFASPIILWTIVGVFVLKVINLFITKLKFKQLGSIHTILSKLVGLIVYISLPVYILFPTIPDSIFIAVSIIALLAAFEETLILLTSKNYDLNSKSIFSKR